MIPFEVLVAFWQWLWRLLRPRLAEKRRRALDAANEEADRLLYAADPEFAVEMGYEPPKTFPRPVGGLMGWS